MAIVNSTIANNSVNSGGGGVDNQGGVMSLVDCQISGNTAGSGGGIRNSGTLAVSSSYIIGNQVQAAGGGISVESGYLVLTDSQIQGNSAAGPAHASPNYAGPALGGGLYVGGGNVARLHQRLPGQQRRGCQRRARLVVSQSLIGGAGGAGYGGAICVEAGNLQLEHNTITWNEAVGGSGGDAIFPSYTGTLEGYLLSYCCSSGLMAYLVPGVWPPYGVDSPGDYAALAGNGGSGQGGGISILGGTVTAISNVFSDNQSIGGNGGDAQGGYLGYYEHSGYDMYTGEFFDETWPIYATISPGTSGSSSGADISGPIQFLQNNSFTTVGGSAVDTMTPLVINQFTVDQGEAQRSNIESVSVKFNQDTNVQSLIDSGTITSAVQVVTGVWPAPAGSGSLSLRCHDLHAGDRPDWRLRQLPDHAFLTAAINSSLTPARSRCSGVR